MSGPVQEIKIGDYVRFTDSSLRWKGLDPPYRGRVTDILHEGQLIKVQHMDTEWGFNLRPDQIEVVVSPYRAHLNAYRERAVEALDLLPMAELEQMLADLDGVPPKTIFLAGNGGSATICDHFELEIGAVADAPFRAVSLCNRAAWLTCIGNDYSFEDVFKSQLQRLAGPDDLVVFLSGSGGSKNLVEAAAWCKENGYPKVWAFTGPWESPKTDYLAGFADRCVVLEPEVEPRGWRPQAELELCFFWIAHAICYYWIDPISD